MYEIDFQIFKDTDSFRPAAIHFQEHGYYTSAPKGTTAFREYWDTERERCLHGYVAPNGIFISGFNYFYLNYCPILLVKEIEVLNRRGEYVKKKIKDRDFPRFYDFDKYFFDAVEECILVGKHLIVLKSRRKGYSYKIAAMLCRNFFLVPNSKGFALASEKEYLTRDGILSKAWEIMSFIDEHTAWSKKRQKIDTVIHKRASLVIDKGDGVKTEVGYKSDIIGVSLSGDYNKARGKCFGKDTNVLMSNGEIKHIQDIVEGDLVMGPDSLPRRVLKTHKGYDKLFEITPSNGDIQIVNSNHDIYYDYWDWKKREGERKLIKPEEYINISKNRKAKFKLVKTGVEYSYSPVFLDPYWLGLWLGDGSIKKTEITTEDKEIKDYIVRYAKSIGCTFYSYCKKHNPNVVSMGISGGGKGVKRNIVLNELRRLGIINNKDIPKEYLINSKEIRLSLLAGIVDTDGYYDVPNGRFEIIQKNKSLSESIVYLSRSLGFKTSINTKEIKGYGIFYRINILSGIENIPVKIVRKKAKHHYKKFVLDPLKTTFEVTEYGYGEYYGFTVDKDNLFLLGDFTISHNSGELVVFEEAGKFKNLKAAWQVGRPSVEQGSNVHGLMIAFGTGGTEQSDFEGLKQMYYEPDAYNCLAIKDIWEEENMGKAGGFFVPYTANLEGDDVDGESFMDDQGNSLISRCKNYVLRERKKIIDNASDRTMIDRYVAEHCLTPSEATLNISTNIFPKEELLRHLANIRNSEKLKESKQVGDLIFDSNGKVIWIPTNTPKDIINYRLKKEDNRDGQIVIWEHPIKDPPYGLYIGGIDPYDHDKSTTDSLLSIFIYKRVSGISSTQRVVVAEYSGRPEFAEQAYEKCRMLLLYYNATALYENQCKGLFTYFAHKHSEYLLADQPEILKDIIKNSTVDRRKGIHMSKEIKIYGEGKIKEWLNEETSPGIKRLTSLMSEPLIEELISYNDTGNFDRCIAFMLVLLYEEELFKIIIRKRKSEMKDRLVFREPLFQQNIIFNF